MKGVAKAVGQTPLEALREYGVATGRPDVRRSYAGRLDPMAEGLLAVLEEEACDGQAEAQHSTKRYAWELLLGVSSDSFDVLGLLRGEEGGWAAEERPSVRQVTEEQAAEAARVLDEETAGRRRQAYPPFSSARVRGHPLFWWAQQGRLNEVQIPQVEVEVTESKAGCVRWESPGRVLAQVIARVGLVNGQGFRQERICARWRMALADLPDSFRFAIVTARCAVSSGTYMRSLAEETGRRVGCGGLAWSICRTQVGETLSLLDAFPLRPVSKELFEKVWRLLKQRGLI